MKTLCANIRSLNVGHPQEMEWQGRSIVSSMEKRSTHRPLVVGFNSLEGDSFKNQLQHGTVDSVLYLMGADALAQYSRILGKPVEPGAIGENVTVDSLDESEVFVGDIFQIGEVRIQATFPRTPCGKLNFRMQHPDAQQGLKDLGRSGFYSKILRPGLIYSTDRLVKVSEFRPSASIREIYASIVSGKLPNHDLYISLKDNPHIPGHVLKKICSA